MRQQVVSSLVEAPCWLENAFHKNDKSYRSGNNQFAPIIWGYFQQNSRESQLVSCTTG